MYILVQCILNVRMCCSIVCCMSLAGSGVPDLYFSLALCVQIAGRIPTRHKMRFNLNSLYDQAKLNKCLLLYV